jgi:hypothetical protein
MNIKRISIGAIMAVVFLGVPFAGYAAELAAGEHYVLPSGKSVIGNLYIAGQDAIISGNVQGDVVFLGGTVLVSGTISGDLIAVSGDVTVLGSVVGDVRIFAAQAKVLPGAMVGGDLMFGGAEIIAAGNVGGDMMGAALKAALNGVVGGKTRVSAQELMLLDHAMLKSDLEYWSPSVMGISRGAAIAGNVTYHPAASQIPDLDRVLGLVFAFTIAAKFFMVLALGFLLFWAFPKRTEAVIHGVFHEFWYKVLKGIGAAIFVPIAATLLLFSVIGIPVAVLVFAAYIALFTFATVGAGIAFGSFVHKQAQRRKHYEVGWWTVFGGLCGIVLIQAVPLLGALICAIFFCAAFGTLSETFWNGIKKWRE